jgi:hypothetical protein
MSQIPPGTFITHTCPLFPLISICICVPLVSMVLSIIVTMSVGACEYLCCVFWAFMLSWLQVSSRVIIIARVGYLFEIVLALLSFYPVFCYLFFWSSSPCLYTARHNLCLIKTSIMLFLCMSPESLHTNVTHGLLCSVGVGDKDCSVVWGLLTWTRDPPDFGAHLFLCIQMLYSSIISIYRWLANNTHLFFNL